MAGRDFGFIKWPTEHTEAGRTALPVVKSETNCELLLISNNLATFVLIAGAGDRVHEARLSFTRILGEREEKQAETRTSPDFGLVPGPFGRSLREVTVHR